VALRTSPASLPRLIAGVLIVTGLGYYYLAGAIEHANTVNTFKARGDQSAYLAEAKLIYDNWHGVNDPPILQPRNRMPLYPAFLAARYDPKWSDPEFFEHAKRFNIELSMVLLAIVAVVLTRHLPTLPAANLTLIMAFGYFAFKAGYVQSELLFYTLHFLTFVAFWHLLESQPSRATIVYAVLAGVLAALAHLTKAAMLPLAALFLGVYAIDGLVRLIKTRQIPAFGWRFAGCVLFAASFLVVLYPYIANSKRVHGQYFYNLNTSALMWYDNYPQASVEILSYGPDGWPPGRRSARPGPLKYWREHTIGQIVARFDRGFRDMLVRSHRTFWYLKFVTVYVVCAGLLIASAWSTFRATIRRHAALAVFLFLYAAVYGPAVAFYEPISGTGTIRFLLVHVAPLLFLLSVFFESASFRDRHWTLVGVEIGPPHVHVLLLAIIGLDLTFTLWPRLMTTYGGF
jgi:hypothetical protein